MSASHSTRMNPRVKDLTGQVFGRLTVLERAGSNPRGRATWKCKCDCGNETTVLGNNLLSGNTNNCKHHGHIKHGHASAILKSRTYYAWSSMKKRCKPNSLDRKNYYDCGIEVCDRWKWFDCFLLDMGVCPEGYELDRIDNDKGYEPDNCRWTDESTQRRNQRKVKQYEHNGQSMILIDWAKQVDIHYNTLVQRIVRSKWSFQKTITTPVQRKI